MNAVGIDVSKGKSTVAVMQLLGIVVSSPHDVSHNEKELKELSDFIKELSGETKVVMEATGVYYEPIAKYLHAQGIFVSVVNPVLIKDFGGNTIRKVKTDKKDAIKIAQYTLNYWSDLMGLKNKLCNRIIHQKMTILKLQPKRATLRSDSTQAVR